MKRFNEKRFLIIIFIVSLILRVLYVLFAKNAGLIYDEKDYDLIATNLVSGKGFSRYEGIPTTFRPPLYPFFLSFVYLLFGKNYFFVRIFQAILGSLVPIITYFICKKVFNIKTAKISALILTLYVPFILYTTALLTENLFIPLTGLAVLFLFKSQNKSQFKYCFLSGIFFGLAILTRPSLSAFIPIIFFWFYYPQKNLKTTLKNFSTILVTILILITPWIIRNYLVTDQFVFLDTRTGYSLYIGYNPNATGRFNFESTTMLNSIVDETERHNWGMKHAIDFIKQNPLKSLLLVPKKFFYFWDLDKREFITAYSWNSIGELHPLALLFLFSLIMIPFALIVILGITGIMFTNLNKKIWLLLLIIFYYTALHSLTFAESRMHIVLVPFIAILATNGLYNISKIKSDLLSTNQKIKNKTIKKLVICIIIISIFIFMWIYGILLDLPNFKIIFSNGGSSSYLTY